MLTSNFHFDRVVLATGNRNKYREFKELLPSGGVIGDLVFASELPGVKIPEVEETGSTFMMNALLKAMAWSKAAGLPCLADDSGIEVRALGWEPGVHSARVWDGEKLLPDDGSRNRWLLARMEDKEDRRGAYTAAVAFSMPDGQTFACEGVCEGRVAKHETGLHGFGYDPLFIPDGYEVSFGELPLEVKNRISHRARALAALMELLAIPCGL